MITTMSSKKKPDVNANESPAAEERPGRRTAPIQVERDLARMAAVIASHDGVTQSDVVSDHLRPFLTAHYERVMKAIGRELKGDPPAE